MENRGNWLDLIPDTGLKIREVYDQGDEEYTPGIFVLLKTKNGEGAQANYRGKTGAGELEKFDEGDAVPSGKRYPTYLTQVAYNAYGKSIEVTKLQIEDRDFAPELDEMKDLSRAANESIDKSGCQLFNGGFSTATEKNGYTMSWYGDGKALFSTAHPTVVPGASSQSNASSTGIAFSEDNLETGRLAVSLQQTDEGKPMSMAGKLTVVLPLYNDKLGQQVTMSTLVSDSDYNAINTYKGNTDMVTSPYFDAVNGGSNTAWFVVNTTRAKLFHETRQEKRLESDVDIKTKTVTFTVDARWADSALEWKGTWGSKGDAQSYTG